MEAISPSFDIVAPKMGVRAHEKAGSVARPVRPVAPAVPATAVRSISIPLRFFALGMLCLLAVGILITVRPALLATYHYNQYVIAVTHLMTLGFVSSIIMGAMYQLVPVALETALYSERLARWQFVFQAIGVVGMVWMFWRWDLQQVGHFASVLAVGVGCFVYNMVRTLKSVERWNGVAAAIGSALVWLSLTVLAGLALAAGKCTYELADTLPATTFTGALVHTLKSTAGLVGRFDAIAAMHAHAHLGGIGFFLLLVIGISYRLVPMFTLSEVQSATRVRISIWLMNGGLAGLFVTVLLRHPLKLLFTLIVISAIAIYFWELSAILRARRRKTLDHGLVYFISALVMLAFCCLLACVLSWPGLPLTPLTGQLENLYGFLFLVGVITFAILGMLYKILPFLVWYGRYSAHIGRAKVPLLSELYSPRFQVAGYWLFLLGVVLTSAAILLGSERLMPWGCGLLLLSLVLFFANAGVIASHLLFPRLKPLTAK